MVHQRDSNITPLKETQDLSFKSWEKSSFKRDPPPSTAADADDYESRSYLSPNSDDNDDDYENKGKLLEIVTPMRRGTKNKRTIPANDNVEPSSLYFSSDYDPEIDNILPSPEAEDRNDSDGDEDLFPSLPDDEANVWLGDRMGDGA